MSGGPAERDSADRLRERVPGSEVRVWLLLEANRWLLTAALLGLVFLALVALAWSGLGSFAQAVSVGDPVGTLFQAMLTAIVTGVTLVVTINQLVLSQELGPVGDQQSRMAGAMEFRSDAESHIEEAVSPPDPAAFFQSLLARIERDAEAVAAATRSGGETTASREVAAFADEVASNASTVNRRFEGAEFGTFDVVGAALDFNYSVKIYEGRRLRATHSEALTDEADEALEGLVEALRVFAPAREHFKTLYFQWSLIDLSRAILYASVPALVTAAAMILLFDGSIVRGATAGIEHSFLLASLALVVTIAPFMLLLAYILRIATVAKRTLAIGPFVLRDESENGHESR